jgi:hypothetical protein
MVILTIVLGVQLSLVATRRLDRSNSVDSLEDFAAGDTLPPAVLWQGTNEQDIRSIYNGRCGVVIFFDSRCSVCESIAPQWSGRSTVRTASEVVLPVTWVSVAPTDSAASTFMSRHRIPGPHFAIQDVAVRRELRVNRWPLAWLVRDQVFLGLVPRTPAELSAIMLPSLCDNT